jgi:hypothetical protein
VILKEVTNMKIIRNGIEYELTHDEMREAYDELSRYYLEEDVESRVDYRDLDESDIKYIARVAQRSLDNNESYWEAYWMSIEYAIDDYLN